jgi:hypothetical protein
VDKSESVETWGYQSVLDKAQQNFRLTFLLLRAIILIERSHNMTFETNEYGNLVIKLDEDDKSNLEWISETEEDEFDSDEVMHYVLDQAVLDAGYDFVSPEDVGALTSAPILAKMNENNEMDENSDVYGFMDYQIISLQRRLLEDGEAILTKG